MKLWMLFLFFFCSPLYPMHSPVTLNGDPALYIAQLQLAAHSILLEQIKEKQTEADEITRSTCHIEKELTNAGLTKDARAALKEKYIKEEQKMSTISKERKALRDSLWQKEQAVTEVVRISVLLRTICRCYKNRIDAYNIVHTFMQDIIFLNGQSIAEKIRAIVCSYTKGEKTPAHLSFLKQISPLTVLTVRWMTHALFNSSFSFGNLTFKSYDPLLNLYTDHERFFIILYENCIRHLNDSSFLTDILLLSVQADVYAQKIAEYIDFKGAHRISEEKNQINRKYYQAVADRVFPYMHCLNTLNLVLGATARYISPSSVKQACYVMLTPALIATAVYWGSKIMGKYYHHHYTALSNNSTIARIHDRISLCVEARIAERLPVEKEERDESEQEVIVCKFKIIDYHK